MNTIEPAGTHFTAGELAQALSTLPPDTPVYVRGYEGGVDYVTEIQPVTVEPFANGPDSFEGQHDRFADPCSPTSETGVQLAGWHIDREES